jgi:hypothetical protein
MVEFYALVFLDLLYFTLCLICMIVWMAHHQSIMVGQFPFFLFFLLISRFISIHIVFFI